MLPIVRLLELIGAVRKDPVEVSEKPVGVEELEVIRVNDNERVQTISDITSLLEVNPASSLCYRKRQSVTYLRPDVILCIVLPSFFEWQ